MPNHVTNELHFHHCTEDRFHEILKDIQSDEAGLGSIDFRKLIPEPEGLYMGDLGIEEMKRYKDNNWYDWRTKNWNTKWNAYGFEVPTYSGDTGTMTFLTANCSPFRVLFKLSEKYPDVEFELRYADEDLGYNVGEISFIAGELIDDNSPQEGTAVAQELAADIMGIELSFDINSASGYVLSLLGNYYESGLDSFGAQPHNMWRNFPLITEASRRLQNVVIENKDFEKLIAQYDRPNTIFYLDPPYYETEDYYEDVGFGRADHERLCNALMKIKGKFLLSYNDCPEIRELYSREGIMIESTTRLSNIAQRYDAGKQYPELLISNYDTYEEGVLARQLTLFDDLEESEKILKEHRIIWKSNVK